MKCTKMCRVGQKKIYITTLKVQCCFHSNLLELSVGKNSDTKDMKTLNAVYGIWDTVVSIETWYGLDRPGIKSQ